MQHSGPAANITAEGCLSPWFKLIERSHPGSHFVQMYEADESALTENVCHYLWEGLRRGQGCLVIATAEHQQLFREHLKRLGADLPVFMDRRQLVFLDAKETLAQFTRSGQPEWRQFEKVVRGSMREVLPNDIEGVRAYGEMVNVLWQSRQLDAAIRLEQLWNKLLEQCSFSLYCSYGIDVFGKDFQLANVERVLCAHTHLLPSQTNGALETVLNRSMDEFFGPEANTFRARIKADNRHPCAVMPTAERAILWLRENLPDEAEEIMMRAREHYRRLQSGSHEARRTAIIS